MDTKIEDVLREKAAEPAGYGEQPITGDNVYCWADAIEAAMREPVAEVDLPGACDPRRGVLMSREDQIRLMKMGRGTKLYALPPDAMGEIERLKAENERLRALVEVEPDLEAALAGKEVSHE